MSAIQKHAIQAKYIESSQTTQYTASNVIARIDNITISNPTALSATFSLSIVPSGGSVSASNTIYTTKTVLAGEVFLCSGLWGKILNSGEFISAIAGTSSALVIDASVTEIS